MLSVHVLLYYLCDRDVAAQNAQCVYAIATVNLYVCTFDHHVCRWSVLEFCMLRN
jgi:hypothetical protein